MLETIDILRHGLLGPYLWNIRLAFVKSPIFHVLVPSKSPFVFLFDITNHKETLFLENGCYFCIGKF